jgi:hypothetical protein
MKVKNILILNEERICVLCGSSHTNYNKDGSAKWYNLDEYQICQKCYDKLINHPKNNPKRRKYDKQYIKL